MTELEKAIAAIESQQSKMDKDSMAFCVGEQLKDIIRATPGAAEVVLQDLDMKGMGVADCEKKIAEYAKAHKTGNCGCCPPRVADGIIRKFYGLPEPQKICSADLATTRDFTAEVKVTTKKKISLADFLK